MDGVGLGVTPRRPGHWGKPCLMVKDVVRISRKRRDYFTYVSEKDATLFAMLHKDYEKIIILKLTKKCKNYEKQKKNVINKN